MRALARLQLYAMDDATHGDVAQRHGVARPDWCTRAAHDLVADLHAARRDNVAPLTVGVLQEHDVRRTVRIVLQALCDSRYAVFGAFEIDDAVVLLMPATTMPRGDPACIVAAPGFALAFQKRLVRGTFVQVRIDHLDNKPATRRCWFGFYDSHAYSVTI